MARALNVRTIDAIKPHKTKRQEIPDNIVRGLYLVVQPSGAKSWAVRYRHDGKPTKLTLGPCPRLGLGEARTAARETLGIVSEGNDPTADVVTLKRLKRLPAADGNRTFEAVKRRFIESQRAKGRRTVGRIEAIIDRDATPHLEGSADRRHHRGRRPRADRGYCRPRLAGRRRPFPRLDLETVFLCREGATTSRQSGQADREPGRRQVPPAQAPAR